MKEKDVLRLSILSDDIINDYDLFKYNKKEIVNIIDENYYLDRYELDWVLLRIHKKLNNHKDVMHEQKTLI